MKIYITKPKLIVIAIIVVVLCIAINVGIFFAIANSDLPFWVKFLLLK